MSEKIFFGKQKNDDRDCCIYIDRPKFECGHYYHVPTPFGVCYSSNWCEDGEYDYDYLDTVLTKEEYYRFRTLCYELNLLSDGLDKNEDRKKLADAKAEELNKFIDKYLLSAKAIKFAEKIKQGEIEFMKEEYDLDDEDMENIYDYYSEEYFDRAIIGRIFDSSYDVAEESIDNNYNIDDWIKDYIDYNRMGNDIIRDGDYVELSDCRIVELCY